MSFFLLTLIFLCNITQTYQTNQPHALANCAHPSNQAVDKQEEAQRDNNIGENLMEQVEKGRKWHTVTTTQIWIQAHVIDRKINDYQTSG